MTFNWKIYDKSIEKGDSHEKAVKKASSAPKKKVDKGGKDT